MSKETGLLCTGEMVRAILDGRKTQTRRVIKPQPEPDPAGTRYSKSGYWWRSTQCQSMIEIEQMTNLCPYGKVGDKLWVRVTWCAGIEWDDEKPGEIDPLCGGNDIWYLADGEKTEGYGKTRPNIFMPKWAARIRLEITGVRVERVQEITWQDCKAEGITLVGDELVFNNKKQKQTLMRTKFERLWDSINGTKYPWKLDPFVWVVTFERIKP